MQKHSRHIYLSAPQRIADVPTAIAHSSRMQKELNKRLISGRSFLQARRCLYPIASKCLPSIKRQDSLRGGGAGSPLPFIPREKWSLQVPPGLNSPGPSPKGAPVVMTECGFRGSGQEGRPRLFQNPGRAGPGREPELGRVILGLAEKSSKGRAGVSELPRARGGEVGGAEAGK